MSYSLDDIRRATLLASFLAVVPGMALAAYFLKSRRVLLVGLLGAVACVLLIPPLWINGATFESRLALRATHVFRCAAFGSVLAITLTEPMARKLRGLGRVLRCPTFARAAHDTDVPSVP